MDKFKFRQDRLFDLIRSEYGGVNASLAKAAGIDPSYLSRMLYPEGKAQKKNITERQVEKISALHPNWLQTGVEDRNTSLFDNSKSTKVGNVSPIKIATRGVPLISYVAAGNWSETVDIHEGDVAEEWFPCPEKHSDRTFALKVKGVSMEDRGADESYSEGDIIYVDPDIPYNHRDLVIAKLDDSNEATFKRLLIDGDSHHLEALNPSWKPRYQEINGNCHIVGVVIGSYRSRRK